MTSNQFCQYESAMNFPNNCCLKFEIAYLQGQSTGRMASRAALLLFDYRMLATVYSIAYANDNVVHHVFFIVPFVSSQHALACFKISSSNDPEKSTTAL